MQEIELLLSDEFGSFSQTVDGIREAKKNLEEEFREQFAEYKSRMAEYDKDVVKAQEVWEAWKSEQQGKSKDKVEATGKETK